MNKKLLFSLWAILIAFVANTANAQTYSYIDETGVSTQPEVTPVTTITSPLSAEWYYVSSETSLTGNLEISGAVNLIVAKNLTINGDIEIPSGSSLTIYGTTKTLDDQATLSASNINVAGALAINGYLKVTATSIGSATGIVSILGGRVTDLNGSDDLTIVANKLTLGYHSMYDEIKCSSITATNIKIADGCEYQFGMPPSDYVFKEDLPTDPDRWNSINKFCTYVSTAKSLHKPLFFISGIFIHEILDEEKHVQIIGCTFDDLYDEIYIPTVVDDDGEIYYVTKIGERLFNNSGLTSVQFGLLSAFAEYASPVTEIPLTTIGKNAFSNNTNLTSINLEDCVNLTSIGESAFAGCTHLPSITIPSSVEEIGDDAFGNCSSLKTVTIQGNSLKKIGVGAFYTTAFREITLPSSIEEIGDQAFSASDPVVKKDPEDGVNKLKIICNAAIAPTLGNNVFIDKGDADVNLYYPLCATGYDAWADYFDNTYFEGFDGFGDALKTATYEKTYDGTADVKVKAGTEYKTISEYFSQDDLTSTNNGVTLTITGLKFADANVAAEVKDKDGNTVTLGASVSPAPVVTGIEVQDKPITVFYSVAGSSCDVEDDEISLGLKGKINPIQITLDDIKPYVKTSKLDDGNYYAYATVGYVQSSYSPASDGKLSGSTFLPYTNESLNDKLMYRVTAKYVTDSGEEPSSSSTATHIKITPYYDSQHGGVCNQSWGTANLNYGFADSYELIEGASIVDETPYVIYDEDEKKLTFKCGNYEGETSTNKMTLNTNTTEPAWLTYAAEVQKVEFDNTFALARPKSCYKWFSGFSALKSIDGMAENLNTSAVTNMDYMFNGCTSLVVIDISGIKLQTSVSTDNMFNGCSSLTTIKIGDIWDSGRISSGDNMFAGCESIIGNTGRKFASSTTGKYGATVEYYLTKGSYKVFVDLDGDGIILNNEKTPRLEYDVLSAAQSIDAPTSHPETNKPYHKFAYWSGSGIDVSNTSNTGALSIPTTAVGNLIYSANWKVPYAVWNSNTFTFKMDVEKDKPETDNSSVFDLNKKSYNPGWKDKLGNVTTVVFDPSFAEARPQNCLSWFYYMSSLTTIEGLQYLYTDEVKDMTQMFYHCLNLTSLNLSNFNTAQVTSMNNMFNTCENLKTIRVGDGWKTDLVTSEYGKDGVFTGCNNLVGESGTNYKTAKVSDVSYARIDGGPTSTTPGYLTYSKYPVDDLIVGEGAKVRVAGLDNIPGLSGSSETTGIALTSEEVAGKTLYYLTTTADVAINDEDNPSYTLTIKEGTEIVANITVTVKDYTSDWYHDYWYKADEVTIPAIHPDAAGYDVYVAKCEFESEVETLSPALLSDDASITSYQPYVAYKLQNSDGDILTNVVRHVLLDNYASENSVSFYDQHKIRSYPHPYWGNHFVSGSKLTIDFSDTDPDNPTVEMSGFGKFGYTIDYDADFANNPNDEKITWIKSKDELDDYKIDLAGLTEGEHTLRYIAYDAAHTEDDLNGNTYGEQSFTFTVDLPNFEVSYGDKKLYYYHFLDAMSCANYPEIRAGDNVTVKLLRDIDEDLPFGITQVQNYWNVDVDNEGVINTTTYYINYVLDFRGHRFTTLNDWGYEFKVKDGSMTIYGEDGDPSNPDAPKTDISAKFTVETGTSSSSMTINGGNYTALTSWSDPVVSIDHESGTGNAIITINGGTFKNNHPTSALVVGDENATVTVNGGKFDGEYGLWTNGNGTIEINGGTFIGSTAAIRSTIGNIINSDYLIYDNNAATPTTYTEQYNANNLAKAADGDVLTNVTIAIPFTAEYEVSEGSSVTKNFASLKDALDYTKYPSGVTDVTITQKAPYSYTPSATDEILTLETLNYTLNLGKITCSNHLTLDVKTNVTIEDGDIDNVTFAVNDQHGNLTIEKGTYQTEGGASATGYVLNVSDGVTTIKDGEFTAAEVSVGNSRAFKVTGGNNTIKGGTFTGGEYGLSVSDNGIVTVTGGTFVGASGISYSNGKLSLVYVGDEIKIRSNAQATMGNGMSINWVAAIIKDPGLTLFTGNNGFFDASGVQIPEHYNSTYNNLVDNSGNRVNEVTVMSVANDDVKFTATYGEVTRGFSTLAAALAETYPASASVTITTSATSATSYNNADAPLTFQPKVNFTLDLGNCEVSNAMLQVAANNNVTIKSGKYNSGNNNDYALDITGGTVKLMSETDKTTSFTGSKAAIKNTPKTTLFDGLYSFFDNSTTPQLIAENYGTTDEITDNVLLDSKGKAVTTATVGTVDAVCQVSYTYDDNGTTKTVDKEFATLNTALEYIHGISEDVEIKLTMLADHTVGGSTLYNGNTFATYSYASLDIDLNGKTLDLNGKTLTFKKDRYYGEGVTIHNGILTSSSPNVINTNEILITFADITVKSTSSESQSNNCYVIGVTGEQGIYLRSGTVIESSNSNHIYAYNSYGAEHEQMEPNCEMVDKNGKVLPRSSDIYRLCPNVYDNGSVYEMSQVTVQKAEYFKAVAEYADGSSETKYFGWLALAVTEDNYKTSTDIYPTKVTITQVKDFQVPTRFGRDYQSGIDITHSDFDITLTSIPKDSLYLNISKTVKITGTDASKVAAYFNVGNGGKLEITGGNFGNYAGPCEQCDYISENCVVHNDGGEVTISGGSFTGGDYGVYANAGTITLSSADNDKPTHITGDICAIVNNTSATSLLPTNTTNVLYTGGAKIDEKYSTSDHYLVDASNVPIKNVRIGDPIKIDVASLVAATKQYDGTSSAYAAEGKWENATATDFNGVLDGTNTYLVYEYKIDENTTYYVKFLATADFQKLKANTTDEYEGLVNADAASRIFIQPSTLGIKITDAAGSDISDPVVAFAFDPDKLTITTGRITPHVLTLPDWSDIQTKVTTSKFFDNSSAATIAAENTINLTGVGTETVPVTLTEANFATSATATATDVGTDYGMLVTFKLGDNVTNYIFEEDVTDNEGNTTTTYVKEITKFYSADDVQGKIKTAYFTASYTVVENETSTEVTKNFSTLEDALAEAYPTGIAEVTVTQVADYTATNTTTTKNVTISGLKFTLDLTGHKFTDDRYNFTIDGNGSSLTINGEDGDPNNATAPKTTFTNTGFTVINNGNIAITGGTFDSDSYGVNCYSNATGTISGGSFTAILAAVYVQGTSGEVKLSGGSFTGTNLAAIVNMRYDEDANIIPLLESGYTFALADGTYIQEDYSNNEELRYTDGDGNYATCRSVSVKKLAPHTITLPNDKWTATDANDATNTSITKAIYGTTVTVTYSGSKTVKEVKVYPMPKSITIVTPASTSLSAGEKLTLTATISPTTIADEDNVVTWTSSDDNVATVSEKTGEVKAGDTTGEVIITATTTNGKTATITLTVQ